MAIDLCKTDLETNESSFLPICTSSVFAEYWLPVAEELGLEMVECLPGLAINPEYKGQFLSELNSFRSWVDENGSPEFRKSILLSVDQLVDVVTKTSLDQFDLSTG